MRTSEHEICAGRWSGFWTKGGTTRRDSVGLFSGHGVQNNYQMNYLLPVDARIEDGIRHW
jgi:hypothetical protein